MKTLDVEQGSDEWLRARLGKVTSSRVADVVRAGKGGRPSASRATYLGELVAERLSGEPSPSFTTRAMEWGLAHEDEARAFYGFMRDLVPVRVGLVLHPAIEMAAASPDGLIGDDGLLEIKAPNSATHIESLRGAQIEPDYGKQMQWQMACTGRLWCDFASYDPRMPERLRLHVVRVRRDPAMIEVLETQVRAFLAEVDEVVRALDALCPLPLAAE